jgi:hypothetical protein
MSRSASWAIAALFILALAGCSGIKAGVITEKKYEESREYTVPLCTQSGKVLICIPQHRTDDEDWYVGIVQGEDSNWISVTQETYDSYEVGDYIDFR